MTKMFDSLSGKLSGIFDRLTGRGALNEADVAEAMREAAARGAQAVLLEVAEPNVAARALYAGFGFQEVGQRRHYYADGSDALVLRYDIGTA